MAPNPQLVSQEVRESLASKSILYRYPPGAIAYYQEGDEDKKRNTNLHFVIAGVMRIEGRYKEKIVHARTAGGENPDENVFGEVEAFMINPAKIAGLVWETPNVATVWAEKEAKVIQIDVYDFAECQKLSTELLLNMQEWLSRRTFRYLAQPIRDPNMTAKDLLDGYIKDLFSTARASGQEEVTGISLPDLLAATGGISRQRLYELLQNAKKNNEYEFDARRKVIKDLGGKR